MAPAIDETPETLPSLISALADSDWRVRTRAADALGSRRDRLVVEPLIAALADAADSVRESAARALGRLGDERAVEPLIGVLGDRDDDARRNAAEALGALADRRAVDPLIGALGDRASGVANAAAEALGALGDSRAIQPLRAALQEALDSDDDFTDRHLSAARALRNLGDEEVVPLLVSALDPEGPRFESRLRAAAALGALGDQSATEALISCLKDWDPEMRATAAEALGRLGDRRAVEPLVDYLKRRLQDDLAADKGVHPWTDEAAQAILAVDPETAEPQVTAWKRSRGVEKWPSIDAIRAALRMQSAREAAYRSLSEGESVLGVMQLGSVVNAVHDLADVAATLGAVQSEALLRKSAESFWSAAEMIEGVNRQNQPFRMQRVFSLTDDLAQLRAAADHARDARTAQALVGLASAFLDEAEDSYKAAVKALPTS